MPAYTLQQAQTYYNTLTPDQKAAVDASGGPSIAWLTNAVNAGVPAAQSAVGGQAAVGEGEPTSAWYGKRKPTPKELIRYYKETGKSEDFDRFEPRQVAKWIDEKWNVQGGYFTNDFGDRVEKPTEAGPRSIAAGYATGEGPEHGGFKSGPGGGAGAGGAGAVENYNPYAALGLYGGGTVATPEGYKGGDTQFQDLQRALEDKFLGRSNIFGLADARTGPSGPAGEQVGKTLAGGGLWWGSDKSMFDMPAAIAQPAARRGQGRRPRAQGQGTITPEVPVPPTTPAAAPPAPTPAPVPQAMPGLQRAMFKKSPYYRRQYF